MTDRVTAFFVNEVDPTVREFLADFGDVRRARLATMMVVHTADHFWHARPTERAGTSSEDAFRAHLSAEHGGFRLLCDVANASKHAVLRRRAAGKPPTLLTRADQVAERSLGWGEAGWDEGRWGSPPQVVVSLDDGSLRVLEGSVRECHAMWCVLLGTTLPPLPD